MLQTHQPAGRARVAAPGTAQLASRPFLGRSPSASVAPMATRAFEHPSATGGGVHPFQLTKRIAGKKANRAFHVGPAGKPTRTRRTVQRFTPPTPGRPHLVYFNLGGARRRGLHPGSHYTHRVRIQYSGSRAGDYARANVAAGLGATPPGMVWHHYHNYQPAAGGGYGNGTMYLMPVASHARGHTGGVAQFEHHHGIAYG